MSADAGTASSSDFHFGAHPRMSRVLSWASTAILVLRLAGFFTAGGWVLAAYPRLNASARGLRARLLLSVWLYVSRWTVIWAIFLWLDRFTLVSSRAGTATALEVLPAVIVAVLVLTLGSLFVIAQGAVATWGTRSPVMLVGDAEVAATISRPLVLTVAALLLSGQVPDTVAPADELTAAVTVLMLATARLIPSIATSLPGILQRYTLPRGFPQYVVDRADLERELNQAELGLVVFRGPLLGEMLRLALRRGDSVAVRASLEAIDDFARLVIEATSAHPELRRFVTDDGAEREGWLAEDLRVAMVAAADTALQCETSGDDLNRIARVLAGIAEAFLLAGDRASAAVCIDGLTEMSTSHVQVRSDAINVNSEPAGQLSWIEAQAEHHGDRPSATLALAGWALAAAYARYHLGATEHPLHRRSLTNFGPVPPWRDALAHIVNEETGWQCKWATSWATSLCRYWLSLESGVGTRRTARAA